MPGAENAAPWTALRSAHECAWPRNVAEVPFELCIGFPGVRLLRHPIVGGPWRPESPDAAPRIKVDLSEQDGILALTLPKKADTASKRIAVQ
jgi:hypothetical protein